MSIKRFFKSINNANSGIKYVLKHENNFKFQLLAAVIVTFLIFFFRTSTIESAILLLCVSLVITLELINTSVEVLIDLFKPRLSEKVKVAKDILASAVYVVSIFSFIIGLIIFYPYFIEYLQG